MTKKSLIIATRESPLALWQANWVKSQLEQRHPALSVQLLGITTQADKMLATPLFNLGGKGLFVKELEEALFDQRADIAVHSMKDVPMELPSGLLIPVMCEREEPRDAFVSNQFSHFRELPLGAKVGTSSLRRQSQLLAERSDLQIVPLRGNVNTRLEKLDKGEFSAIILAGAGLMRLGLASRIRSYLSVDDMLPAAGQGVLGIECRDDDSDTKALIAPLNHSDSQVCVTAERAMCRYLGGGCQVPIGAFAVIDEDQVYLRGLVAKADGSQVLRGERREKFQHADKAGITVAQELLQYGAKEILRCQI